MVYYGYVLIFTYRALCSFIRIAKYLQTKENHAKPSLKGWVYVWAVWMCARPLRNIIP